MGFEGLNMRKGQMTNDRPQSEMGITKAARLRRELKSSRTIRDIAEGIELAEQQKEMRIAAQVDMNFLIGNKIKKQTMPNSMMNEPMRTNMANQQQIVQPVEQLPVRNTQADAIMNGNTNSANRMQGNRIRRTYVPLTFTERVQDRMRGKRGRGNAMRGYI